jgi:hypothetical protein
MFFIIILAICIIVPLTAREATRYLSDEERPPAPTTSFQVDQIDIAWTAVDSESWFSVLGNDIVGYEVMIQQKDGDYSPSPSCDMEESILTTCSVPVSELRAAPYSLEWGD